MTCSFPLPRAMWRFGQTRRHAGGAMLLANMVVVLGHFEMLTTTAENGFIQI